MTAARIIRAQKKGLRHQFAGVASNMAQFCRQLYVAFGGSIGPGARG
jgi:hypothetical protein